MLTCKETYICWPLYWHRVPAARHICQKRPIQIQRRPTKDMYHWKETCKRDLLCIYLSLGGSLIRVRDGSSLLMSIGLFWVSIGLFWVSIGLFSACARWQLAAQLRSVHHVIVQSLLSVYRALLSVYRALLSVYSARSVHHVIVQSPFYTLAPQLKSINNGSK